MDGCSISVTIGLMDPNSQPQPVINVELPQLEVAPGAMASAEQIPDIEAEMASSTTEPNYAPALAAPAFTQAGNAAAPAQAAGQPATVVLSPGVADDVDVIEKEWVDAAEKLIADTKTDPFQEEEAEEKLQIDYLKKRYGIDVKKS